LLEAKYPGEIVLSRVVVCSTRIELITTYGTARRLLDLAEDALLDQYHITKVEILRADTPIPAPAGWWSLFSHEIHIPFGENVSNFLSYNEGKIRIVIVFIVLAISLFVIVSTLKTKF
jgi:hypothetical protein